MSHSAVSNVTKNTQNTFCDPRIARILQQFRQYQIIHDIQPLIEEIWSSLEVHLQNPVIHLLNKRTRTVTGMGSVRFIISRESKCVNVYKLTAEKGRTRFQYCAGDVVLDLPLCFRGLWINAFLSPWYARISELFAEADVVSALQCLECTFLRELERLPNFRLQWGKLRHDLRDALELDRALVNRMRSGRHPAKRFYIHQHEYNAALDNRDNYEQLAKENPSLLWLYNLTVNCRIKLVWGDIVAALKRRLLEEEGLTEASWRYLVRCTPKHFDHVISFISDGGLLNKGWPELVHWLRVIAALDRRTLIDPAITALFFHDCFEVEIDKGTILSRGVSLSPSTLRAILREAELRHADGTLDAFCEQDLPKVLVWLAAKSPVLDKNQLRRGWGYLAKQAAQWKLLQPEPLEQNALSWPCLLPVTVLGEYTVVPLRSAWVLRTEAFLMRHCVDSYIGQCIEGRVLIFSVRNSAGKRVATIGLKDSEWSDIWICLDVRGFANRPAPAVLTALAKAITARYNNLAYGANYSSTPAGSIDIAEETLIALELSSINSQATTKIKLTEGVQLC